jgi:L-asparagine transporter-like permease
MAAPKKTPQSVADREAGLHRQLSSRQLSMIALGGAIGTGLFLGSAVSVRVAGPGVILSYGIGALIALALMWALAEMTVVHPVAGSFGVFAEIYLNPWAGFAVRYSYWFAQSVAIGSELVAVSIYCHYWAPGVPAWIWIVLFSAGMVFINARNVGSFGTIEYWFALMKVTTIFVFLVLGTALIFGIGYHPLGTHNYTAFGGFLPHGWTGVILGVAIAIFSYLGLEVVSVAAGEASHPEIAVPRAMRWTLARLALFYIGGMAVLVGVMPWTQAGLAESPFVRVFQATGIPFAGAIMNFVVLTAALSSVNADLYLTTRMLFSLSRGGYAPEFVGKLNKKGVPLAALMISSVGMIIALILDLRFQESAFLYTLGAAFFGGLFGWGMIFVTHLAFRRRFEKNGGSVPMQFAPPGPWSSLAGTLALLGVLISTWWIPGMKITILAGLPWLAFITLCYFLWKRTNRDRLSPGLHGGQPPERA